MDVLFYPRVSCCLASASAPHTSSPFRSNPPPHFYAHPGVGRRVTAPHVRPTRVSFVGAQRRGACRPRPHPLWAPTAGGRPRAGRVRVPSSTLLPRRWCREKGRGCRSVPLAAPLRSKPGRTGAPLQAGDRSVCGSRGPPRAAVVDPLRPVWPTAGAGVSLPGLPPPSPGRPLSTAAVAAPMRRGRAAGPPRRAPGCAAVATMTKTPAVGGSGG